MNGQFTLLFLFIELIKFEVCQAEEVVFAAMMNQEHGW